MGSNDKHIHLFEINYKLGFHEIIVYVVTLSIMYDISKTLHKMYSV